MLAVSLRICKHAGSTEPLLFNNVISTKISCIDQSNEIKGLLISSLPGKALRTLVGIARLVERFNMRSQSRAW